MFWSLEMEPHGMYTRRLPVKLIVTKAALDLTSGRSKKKKSQVICVYGTPPVAYLLSTLHPKQCYQSTLRLRFEPNEEFTFTCNGFYVVHLTGYTLPAGPDNQIGINVSNHLNPQPLVNVSNINPNNLPPQPSNNDANISPNQNNGYNGNYYFPSQPVEELVERIHHHDEENNRSELQTLVAVETKKGLKRLLCKAVAQNNNVGNVGMRTDLKNDHNYVIKQNQFTSEINNPINDEDSDKENERSPKLNIRHQKSQVQTPNFNRSALKLVDSDSEENRLPIIDQQLLSLKNLSINEKINQQSKKSSNTKPMLKKIESKTSLVYEDNVEGTGRRSAGFGDHVLVWFKCGAKYAQKFPYRF